MRAVGIGVGGAAAITLAGAFAAGPARAQGWQPDGEGAYVQVPEAPPPSPPGAPPSDGAEVVAGIDAVAPDDVGAREGALLFAALGVRPHVTWVDAADTETVVAGHVGFRAHATGIEEDFIGRFDLEGFIGASTEGVEGEGKAHLGLGLAAPIERVHHLFFRFGAGGHLLGNRVVDVQLADLPSLELGYVHVGADGFVEIAPRAAMAVVALHQGDAADLEPDPSPALGGRLLAGADDLWATADYELVTGERPVHLALLTACFARRFSLCVDGRLVSARVNRVVPLAGGGPEGTRLTAISAGLSFGFGAAEQED